MDPVTVEPVVGSRVAASDSDRPGGLLNETTRLWDELRGVAHDHLQLAALETQPPREPATPSRQHHPIRPST
jgi:hypothetical protein